MRNPPVREMLAKSACVFFFFFRLPLTAVTGLVAPRSPPQQVPARGRNRWAEVVIIRPSLIGQPRLTIDRGRVMAHRFIGI